MNTDPASFLSAVRSNESLMVALALAIGPALVLTLIGFILRRAGASLKPVVLIAGLMLPIVLTFALGQLVLARAPAPAQASVGLAIRDGQFADRAKLFGAGVPAELIRDAKSGLPGILDAAEVAEAGITPAGETVLIAQFTTDEQARQAGAAYHRGFQLRNTSGDEEGGWRATRMQGDFIEMLRTGRHLFVWSGLTKEAAAARRATSDLATNFPALKPAPRPPLFPALQPLGDFFAPTGMKVAGLLLLVFIYSLGFFKGATWAGSAQPPAGTLAAPMSDLITRLMAINELDIPFTVTRTAKPDELNADWRYADAKWMDLAGAHGLRRTFRIRLTLDESSQTVRATDYTAAFDWSAGRGGAGIEWQAAAGVVFFQREQRSLYGLQLADDGRLKPGLSHTYRFDLNEMKAPIQAAITRSGWTWRPTVWQGPAWLSWLTE